MNQSEEIGTYITDFVQKLKAIDPRLPGIEKYCQTYLTHLLAHSRYYTEIYTHVLICLLKDSGLQKSSAIIVDYGAGNGLLGIFAKFCGFKSVYINDIDPQFTHAASVLAAKMNIPIDGYITGNTEELISYFKNKERPSAIAGLNVIEHVYNLDNFLMHLKKLNPEIVIIQMTGANIHNWAKKRELEIQQFNDEYKGTFISKNILAAAADMPSFFSTRYSLINSAAPLLSNSETMALTKGTRGMIKEDIEKAVRAYIEKGTIAAPPSHPTNTCDPLTGSWAERLLTIDEYKAIFSKAGFEFGYYNGFYNSYEKNIKSTILKFANFAVKVFGKYAAPFITITARGIKQ